MKISIKCPHCKSTLLFEEDTQPIRKQTVFNHYGERCGCGCGEELSSFEGIGSEPIEKSLERRNKHYYAGDGINIESVFLKGKTTWLTIDCRMCFEYIKLSEI